MASRKLAKLGNQTIHGSDDAGANWVLYSLTGWFDRPAPKGNTEDVPYGHGEYDLPDFYGARTIAGRGRASFRTPAEALAGRDRFMGATFGPVIMQVRDETGKMTFSRVKPAGECIATVLGRMLRFEFVLKATDPRRFGEARVVAAGAGVAAMVENRGSAPAWPKIVVPGAVSSGGYTITGPNGEKYVVTASPSSSQTHYVDMWDGMLRVNSSMAAGAGLVGAAQTFTIPPGGKVPVTLSKGGRIELYDTYM